MTPYHRKKARIKERVEQDAIFNDMLYLQRVPLGLMGFPSRPPLSIGIRQSSLYNKIKKDFIDKMCDEIIQELLPDLTEKGDSKDV